MKLRLLCLHSFRTSGESLRKQVAMFSNIGASIDEFADLTYLDAPRKCTAEDEAKIPAMLKTIFAPPYYEWWNSRTESDGTVHYDHCEQAVEHVLTHMAAHGPYDGILGFSQGGSMAHLLCVLAQAGAITIPHARPSFAVIFSARASRHHAHLELMQKARADPLPIPSLVVFGGNDAEVPPDDTRALCETLSPTLLHSIFVPDGTHKVPRLPPDDVAVLRAFFEARLAAKTAAG